MSDTTEEQFQATRPAMEEAVKVWSKDAARAQILATPPDSRSVNFNGVPVEVRTPSMDQILSLQASGDDKEAQKRLGIQIMIDHVYLPNGEQLFDSNDIEALLQLPFNKSMQDVQKALNELSGVAPTEKDKSTTPQ